MFGNSPFRRIALFGLHVSWQLKRVLFSVSRRSCWLLMNLILRQNKISIRMHAYIRVLFLGNDERFTLRTPTIILNSQGIHSSMHLWKIFYWFSSTRTKWPASCAWKVRNWKLSWFSLYRRTILKYLIYSRLETAADIRHLFLIPWPSISNNIKYDISRSIMEQMNVC